jgi:hypothetical protein
VKLTIRSKGRKRQDSVCFPQDNTCPYTAALTMATLLKLKWEVLPHPAYSPDLAPTDYHFFGPIKQFLGHKRFQNNGEVIAGVQCWIHEPLKTFSETGIKTLPKSWHKCIAVNRDYTEKQCVKLFHSVVNKFFRNQFLFRFECPLYIGLRVKYPLFLSDFNKT